jgi:hypothetical protein
MEGQRVSDDTVMRKRQDDRERFLKRLYDVSGADEYKWGAYQQIGDDIGVSADEAQTIAQYLASKDYLRWRTLGGGIGITRRGIDAIERGVRRLSPQATSVITNILNIGTMTNSQLQQGTMGSSQQIVSGSERDEVVRTLAQVRAIVATLPLSQSVRNDIEGNVATVEAQLKTSTPNRSTIRDSIRAIADTLKAFGEAAGLVDTLLKLGMLLMAGSN